jgi:hypothetical protein
MENNFIFTGHEIRLIVKAIYFSLDNGITSSYDESEDLFDLVNRFEESE